MEYLLDRPHFEPLADHVKLLLATIGVGSHATVLTTASLAHGFGVGAISEALATRIQKKCLGPGEEIHAVAERGGVLTTMGARMDMLPKDDPSVSSH